LKTSEETVFYPTRFDAWALLFGLKRKACHLGTEYVQAEVVGFEFDEDSTWTSVGTDYGEKHPALKAVIVKTPRGELKTIHFAYCVIAAGHESANIAEMARIGRGKGILSVPLPVEPR
jgi:FAD-dependent oxidoreductase domain-containing protein 1